jgi:hypothetical protein
MLWEHDAFKYFYLRPMNHAEPSDLPIYGYSNNIITRPRMSQGQI